MKRRAWQLYLAGGVGLTLLYLFGPSFLRVGPFFNLISGFLHPNEGSIIFQGKNISRLAPHRSARLGIGRTFQIVKPLPNLTVLQNVMLGAFMHTSSVQRAERRRSASIRRVETPALPQRAASCAARVVLPSPPMALVTSTQRPSSAS